MRPRLLILLAAVLAGCTSHGDEVLPPPPTTQPPPTTTTVLDFSTVDLRGVTGRTTTTVPVMPGQAAIQGTVTGPQGAIGGAVVHAERVVGSGTGSVDTVTNPDGTFAFGGIMGGRYRVRAYKPAPDNLALLRPDVFFLGGNETRHIGLVVSLYAGLDVASGIAPNPPVVGDPANLVIQVTTRAVDPKGVVRAAAVPNTRVELFSTGAWSIDGTNAQLTDGAGRGFWEVRCGAPGDQPLSVLVGDTQSFPIQTGPCAEPPPSTTTTQSTTTLPGPTTPSSTTSTTRRQTTTTSTTTRRGTTTTIVR